MCDHPHHGWGVGGVIHEVKIEREGQEWLWFFVPRAWLLWEYFCLQPWIHYRVYTCRSRISRSLVSNYDMKTSGCQNVVMLATLLLVGLIHAATVRLEGQIQTRVHRF